jgi:Sec-independent protein translocase protein TatA
MNISIGIVLVLSLMVLIFLGPEWLGTFGRKPKRFKKVLRIAIDSQSEVVVGRRMSNRPVTSQSPS